LERRAGLLEQEARQVLHGARRDHGVAQPPAAVGVADHHVRLARGRDDRVRPRGVLARVAAELELEAPDALRPQLLHERPHARRRAERHGHIERERVLPAPAEQVAHRAGAAARSNSSDRPRRRSYSSRRLRNTSSSAERRPTARAPISTAPSARLESSTLGGYGSQAGSSRRTPSSSSGFAPMPPPSTTRPTSVTAAIGTMWRAIRSASSSTTARATPSPARAA